MEMIKKLAKYLIIVDFDGTLYYNPENDFSSGEIKEENIIEAGEFYDVVGKKMGMMGGRKIRKYSTLVLITGRHESQAEYVLNALNRKNYAFNKTLFDQRNKNDYPSVNPEADVEKFIIDYWHWKANSINWIKNNVSESLVIIDDDVVLCDMLIKLGFNVFYAFLTKEKFKTIDSGIQLKLKLKRKWG